MRDDHEQGRDAERNRTGTVEAVLRIADTVRTVEKCQNGSVFMQTSSASSSSTRHKSTFPAITHRRNCATPHKRRSITTFSPSDKNTRHHWVDSLVRSLCNGRLHDSLSRSSSFFIFLHLKEHMKHKWLATDNRQGTLF